MASSLRQWLPILALSLLVIFGAITTGSIVSSLPVLILGLVLLATVLSRRLLHFLRDSILPLAQSGEGKNAGDSVLLSRTALVQRASRGDADAKNRIAHLLTGAASQRALSDPRIALDLDALQNARGSAYLGALSRILDQVLQ